MEVQTHEEAIVYVKELDILDYESPREYDSSIVVRKDLRWKRVFLRMDQWSNNTSHLKRDSDSLQHGELCSYCGSKLVKFVF